MVTVMARCAASRSVMFSSNRIADGLAHPDHLPVIGQEVGHRQVLRRVGLERSVGRLATPPSPSDCALRVYCSL